MGKEVNEAELKLAKAEREEARQVVMDWISKFEKDNNRKPEEADVSCIGTDLAEYNEKNAKYCELKLL
jgi:N-acetylglucosamine kinase-like BadF-type ATPase